MRYFRLLLHSLPATSRDSRRARRRPLLIGISQLGRFAIGHLVPAKGSRSLSCSLSFSLFRPPGSARVASGSFGRSRFFVQVLRFAPGGVSLGLLPAARLLALPPILRRYLPGPAWLFGSLLLMSLNCL